MQLDRTTPLSVQERRDLKITDIRFCDIDDMPKRHSQIIVKPIKQTTTPHRGITDHIDVFYEDGSVYITMWGEGKLVEVEVRNNTNGNCLVIPAEGFCSVVDINDMGCGEYSLLIYCDNDILYTGYFIL